MKLGTILLCLTLTACAAKPAPKITILDGYCRGRCKVTIYIAGAETPLAAVISDSNGYWSYDAEEGKRYDLRFIELTGDERTFNMKDVEGRKETAK